MDGTHHEILAVGLAAHEAGDFSAAEGSYQEILKADPDNGDANHALGLLMMALDKPQLSLEFFRKALYSYPDRSHLWCDYLHGLIGALRVPEAWEVLLQARELETDSGPLDRVEAEILLLISEHNLAIAS